MKTIWKPSVGTLLCGLILLVVGLLSGGCQSSRERHVFSPLPAGVNDEAPTDDPSTHRLLPGEEVTFRFPEGTNYIARIKEDGTISLPLVGDTTAAGKTSYELLVEVRDRYVPRFYNRWIVPVPPWERVYLVSGQVRSPGRQVYIGATTVTKAIQSAGDFTDFAARARVQLTRADGKLLEVNCIKAVKDASVDLPVYPGDKIEVPQRTFWDSFR